MFVRVLNHLSKFDSHDSVVEFAIEVKPLILANLTVAVVVVKFKELGDFDLTSVHVLGRLESAIIFDECFNFILCNEAIPVFVQLCEGCLGLFKSF